MPNERDKEYESWRQIWREGDPPFHREDVHPDLIEFADHLLADGPHRVLVPLCGKSRDLIWLRDRGHEVIGIELVEQAIREFFRENELSPHVETRDGLVLYRSERLTLVCGDIFEVDRSHVGEADRVWDRAALVALPAHLRGDYTRHLRQITSSGWAMLLNAVEYDPSVMSGPPWSVPEEEIRLHFPATRVEILSRRDTLDHNSRFRELGHTWWLESTYLIRDSSSSP